MKEPASETTRSSDAKPTEYLGGKKLVVQHPIRKSFRDGIQYSSVFLVRELSPAASTSATTVEVLLEWQA